MRTTRVLFAVLTLALVAGCATSTSTGAAHLAATPDVTATTSSTAAAAAATATHTPRPSRVTATPTSTPSPRPTRTSALPPRRPLLVRHLLAVDGARQVIAVTASGYGTSYATVTAFERTAHGWRQVFGPWPARIGYNGFAPVHKKREGDGRTPSGSFGFQFMFGVEPNPGVRYRYRSALSTSWWDDDPRSGLYNEWVDSRTADPGRSPEAMRQVPAYRYGAVIGYNLGRTPGRGSAIFLHVAHTGATSGCVSLPERELLAVLRWLDPSKHPRIVMGTTSAVVR